MQVCYVDESGNQASNACLVMVGILADAARLNRTRQEFREIFNRINGVFPGALRELKGSKLLGRGGGWSQVPLETIKEITYSLCTWVGERKHSLVLAAIDFRKHRRRKQDVLPDFCKDPWISAAMHTALQLQKVNQSLLKNKGHTFLIFDENKMQEDKLSELLFGPPAWTRDYYDQDEEREPLDQIIDSAFSVKSHHAPLVQVADLYSYILRRHVETTDYKKNELWNGERSFVRNCIRVLGPRLIARAARWPAKPQSRCARWFKSVAPDALVKL